MNKKLFRFAFALVFVFTGLFFGNFTNVAKATSATLTVDNIKPSSATIRISGADPSQNMTIYVSTINLSYADNKKVYTDDSGEASAEFILDPGKDYRAYIFNDNDNAHDYSLAPFVTFTTPNVSSTSTLDSSTLIGMITEANRVLGEAKDADYPNGAKDKLSAAIIKAEKLNPNSTLITQTDVNETLAELESALNTFQSSKIVATNRSKNTGKIVPICNTKVDTVKGGYSDPCDFNALLKLINNVIAFLLFVIATPFIALILVYAGWLYLSSSASPKNIETAKTIFKNAILGYVLALAAWLIIKTIMTSLGLHGEGTMYLASIISKMFV